MQVMTHARLLCLSVLLMAGLARAENWPQWRGPHFNGSTAETNLPDRIGPGENLLWSVDLPGIGAGTPIVWENRVFVSAIDRETKKLTALCFDRTGKLLWSKTDLGDGFRTTNQSTLASPSAITDGRSVFFYFGTGELAAFDLDGNALWARNIQKDHGTFNVLWIYGSSPLLYKGTLYIPVLHRDVPVSRWEQPASGEKLAESYLLAIDPATGRDLWKHIRPNTARAESKESYCTPIPYEGKERTELLLIGGDAVTAHDPQTGQELWRCGGWNPQKITHWRVVPSLVVANDLIVACTPKRGKVFAIRPGGSGDITQTHIAWETTRTTSDVPVPLYYQQNLYVLDGDFSKGVTCLDPATGEPKWVTSLRSRAVFRASPTGADGKIYVMNEAGQVWVLSAADGKILCESDLGSQGQARASISAAQGQLFVRTADKLYSFGRK